MKILLTGTFHFYINRIYFPIFHLFLIMERTSGNSKISQKGANRKPKAEIDKEKWPTNFSSWGIYRKAT